MSSELTNALPRANLVLPELTNGVVLADASLDDRTITVALKGTADTEGKAELGMLLHGIHAEAQRLVATRVVVDFRKLEFMNSVCFKAFVTWVTMIRALPEDQRYRVQLVSDPAMHWQRRSLAALSRFASDVLVES